MTRTTPTTWLSCTTRHHRQEAPTAKLWELTQTEATPPSPPPQKNNNCSHQPLPSIPQPGGRIIFRDSVSTDIHTWSPAMYGPSSICSSSQLSCARTNAQRRAAARQRRAGKWPCTTRDPVQLQAPTYSCSTLSALQLQYRPACSCSAADLQLRAPTCFQISASLAARVALSMARSAEQCSVCGHQTGSGACGLSGGQPGQGMRGP